jgi:integrase
VQALRQTLEAAVRWGKIAQNPAKLAGPNPHPRSEEIRPFTLAEVDAIAAELGPWGPLVVFAAETGLRPAEWIALERQDVRRDGVLVVERTFAYGRLSPYGKTTASRRRVPLSSRALSALDAQPARLDTRLVFPAEKGGYFGLHNWRARDWHPALEAAGVTRRRPYDLRHTYATHALAAGLTLYEVARYMGTSLAMIHRTYGHLAQGSEERARALLDAYSDRLGQERATGEGEQ